MKQAKTDLLQGTLDLLILRTLASGGMHGWGISQRLQQLSRDVLQVNQGSLYPALYAPVIATLAIVAALACLAPASRAAAIDPMRALRAD